MAWMSYEESSRCLSIVEGHCCCLPAASIMRLVFGLWLNEFLWWLLEIDARVLLSVMRGTGSDVGDEYEVDLRCLMFEMEVIFISCTTARLSTFWIT